MTENEYSNPYLRDASNLIHKDPAETVGARAKNKELFEALTSWIPSAEAVNAIEQGPLDGKMEYAAEMLGLWTIWKDTFDSYLQEPFAFQTGSPTISKTERAVLLRLIKNLSINFDRYTTNLIDTMLGGNLTGLAGHLRSAGQARGFYMKLVYQSTLEQQGTKGSLSPSWELIVTSSDISSQFSGKDSLSLLEDTPVETPISASYSLGQAGKPSVFRVNI